MINIRNLLLGLLLMSGAFPQSAMSTSVMLIDSSGEKCEIEVDESTRFVDVLECIQAYFSTVESEQVPTACHLEVFSHGMILRSKKPEDCYRKFECGYSSQDRGNIKRILTTLARDSFISLASQKSTIEKIGSRINHLHPFCFLLCIFCDEELKCCAHAIRDRGGMVADGFYAGIVDTLSEECKRDNLYQYVDDFAKKVKIDPEVIRPALLQRKWLEFANLLIDNIPRENDPNRYNIM